MIARRTEPARPLWLMCALFGSLAPMVARAQAAVSLAQAQAEARAHAPEARALQLQRRIADLTAADARRVLRNDPVLGVHYGSAFEDREREVGAGLQWTLDVTGSWGPRARAGAAERERAIQAADAGLRELDEAVAIAVAELALAQRGQARAQRSAVLQAVVMHAVRSQAELGQANQLELDAAELDLWAATSEVARAGGDRERAALRLSRLLGRPWRRDLQVQDPEEPSQELPEDVNARLVDSDPGVRAARAAASAAGYELALADRLAWAQPTLGAELTRLEREIPGSAFAGAARGGLSARWTEWEFGLKLDIPLPLFDRNREARTQASARQLAARQQLELARADARTELLDSWVALRSASEAHRALAPTASVVDRSYQLLERAMRAGALNSVERAQAMRRLSDAASHLDTAVRDLRVARARWLRRSARPDP